MNNKNVLEWHVSIDFRKGGIAFVAFFLHIFLCHPSFQLWVNILSFGFYFIIINSVQIRGRNPQAKVLLVIELLTFALVPRGLVPCSAMVEYIYCIYLSLPHAVFLAMIVLQQAPGIRLLACLLWATSAVSLLCASDRAHLPSDLDHARLCDVVCCQNCVAWKLLTICIATRQRL